MKTNWNLLVASVIIGAVGSGLVYIAMAVQKIFPIWLSLVLSILTFCALVIGIYILPIELKMKKEVAVDTIKGKTKVKWKPFLILISLLVVSGLIATFGETVFPYWLYFVFVCIFAFSVLFLIAGWVFFLKKKG